MPTGKFIEVYCMLGDLILNNDKMTKTWQHFDNYTTVYLHYCQQKCPLYCVKLNHFNSPMKNWAFFFFFFKCSGQKSIKKFCVVAGQKLFQELTEVRPKLVSSVIQPSTNKYKKKCWKRVSNNGKDRPPKAEVT